jgi:hypothetical protein
VHNGALSSQKVRDVALAADATTGEKPTRLVSIQSVEITVKAFLNRIMFSPQKLKLNQFLSINLSANFNVQYFIVRHLLYLNKNNRRTKKIRRSGGLSNRTHSAWQIHDFASLPRDRFASSST